MDEKSKKDQIKINAIFGKRKLLFLENIDQYPREVMLKNLINVLKKWL